MHPTRMIRRLALVASTALVAGLTVLAPATPAHAADFGPVTISNLPAVISVPAVAASIPFTVSFTGAPASAGIYYAGFDKNSRSASVVALQTNGVKPVYAPYVHVPTIAPNTSLTYTLQFSAYETPGRYRVTIPIEQRVWNSTTSAFDKVDHYATADITLMATPAATLAQSYVSGTGKLSKSAKWSWRFLGPDYVKGAVVRVYYRATGAKKYAVVASAKLNAAGDAAFKGKKGAIRKTGKAYVVISPVPFSPLTKSSVFKIKKH